MKIPTLRKTLFFIVCFYSISSLSVKSQSKIEVNLGADLVSSYVWRGFKQAGASVQPGISAGIGGFSLGAWGSTDISSSGKKEVDFSASYGTNGFKIAVTDYWWDGEDQYRYFSNPHGDNKGHYLETTLGYTLPESFPLSVSWNTFLLGKGNKKANGKNSYSTFIELSYPFSVKEVDLRFSIGFTPWASAVYPTDGFKFTSIALNVSRNIKINDSFSIPVFGTVICNPAQEDIHLVFGISIN